MRPPPVDIDIQDISIRKHLEDFKKVLHNISFGDGTNSGAEQNIDGVYVDGVTNVTPDTETLYSHILNRVPIGFLVMMRDKAGTIYKGSTAWTNTQISLKSDVASIAFKILIF